MRTQILVPGGGRDFGAILQTEGEVYFRLWVRLSQTRTMESASMRSLNVKLFYSYKGNHEATIQKNSKERRAGQDTERHDALPTYQ